MSMNVGSGFRLIKPAILYMCMQTHYKHDKDVARLRVCVAMVLYHGATSGMSTRIGLHTHNIWLKCSNTLEIYGVVDISL